MRPQTFASLRERNYALLFAGQVVSLTGTWMERIALNQLVYELTGKDARWLGFVAAIPMVPSLLLALPAGALCDRVPPRRVVLVTQTLMMFGAAAMAWIVLAGAVRPWHIAAYAAYSSAVFAVDAVARQTLLVQLVPMESLGNAVALNASMFTSSRFLGGLAFAAIVTASGASAKGLCLVANTASFVFVIGGILAMRLGPTPVHADGHDSGLLAGVRYARRTPVVLGALAALVVMSMFGFQFSHLIPIYADQVYRLGDDAVGHLQSAVGLGSFVGSLTLATIIGRFRPGALMFLYATAAPFVLAALALDIPFGGAMAAGAVAGFLLNQAQSACAAILQRTAPHSLRARVMSLYTTSVLTAFPIGGLVGGFVAHAIGVKATILLDAEIILLAVVLIRLGAPSLRRAG
jgi:MFS family permease